MFGLPTPTPLALQSANLYPEALQDSKKIYQSLLRSLKITLFELNNPFLISFVCKRLTEVSESTIDVLIPNSLKVHFDDPRFPADLKEMLMKFAEFTCAYCSENQNGSNQRLEDFKGNIRDLATELSKSNQDVLKSYEKWEDFQRLFSLPGMMTLNNADFDRLKQFADHEESTKFKEYIENLFNSGKLHLEQITQSLQQSGYTYNLATLVARIVKTKPQKNDGIINYWDQPDRFFDHKQLYIIDPQGPGVVGSIEKSSKQADVREFRLKDSIVHCHRDRVTVTQSYPLKLWSSSVDGLLKHGDTVLIRRSTAANENADQEGIASGKYVVQSPQRVAGHRVQFWKKDGDYFQVDLAKAHPLTPCYRIIGHYANGEQISLIKLFEWNPARNSYVQLGPEQTVTSFNQSYSSRKLVSETLSGINAGNMDRNVLIKDAPNEDRKKLLALAEIEKATESIRNQLLEKEHQPLLQELLSDFYERRSTEHGLRVLEMKAPAILSMVQALKQRYGVDLKVEHSEIDLLKQLILEANYANLVNIQDNVMISRTMGLLEQAYLHIDKMTDQNLVLFMGNTGAGKSTAISFLLGGKLEEFYNQVGDKVLRMKGDDDGFPKIGQSIGTSETLFTQGYPLPGTELMIGDCPGFNDTRGGDYELCTNLSMDQAISKASSIRAIVVVVPAASFTMDRGNPVIDLIKHIQDRFPGTFDPSKPENNKRIFLLISKQNQLPDSVVSKLSNGSRFDALIEEGNKQIQELKSRELESNKYEIAQIQKRQKIWEALRQMHTFRQIEFIDCGDEKLREDLLKQYNDTHSTLDKSQYASSMSDEYMQKKFGNCVQMAAFSWNQQILGEYFIQTPKAIEVKENDLRKKETEIGDLNAVKENNQKHAERRKKQILELTQYNEKLKEYQANPHDQTMREKLLQEAAMHANQELEIEQEALTDVEENLKRKKETLQEGILKIQALKEEIEVDTAVISALNKEINSLKDGMHREVILKKEFSEQDQITMKVWNSKTSRKEAYDRGFLDQLDHDATKEHKIAAKDFKGETSDLVILKRGFKLVPEDYFQRQKFINKNKGGGFIAKVEGQKYKIDWECKFSEDGKKVIYPYTLTWDKKQLPSITITHTIPNAEYYYAEIAILNARKTVLEADLLAKTLRLDGGEGVVGLKPAQAALEKEIGNLELEKVRLQNKIEQIKNDRALEKVQDLISRTQKKIEDLKEELEEFAKTQNLDAQFRLLEKEKAKLQQDIDHLHLRLENLEIIMVTQWESAKLLRKFAELITQNNKSGVKAEEPVLSCLKFMSFFDEKQDEVEKLINKQ